MFIEKNMFYKQFIHENLFTPEECEQIINLEGEYIDSVVDAKSYTSVNGVVNKNLRKSFSKKVRSTADNLWVMQRIVGLIIEVNNLYFHLEVDSFSGIEIVRYKVNDFINWHVDTGLNDKRRITCTVFLSKSSGYEGGQLKWMPDMPPFEQEQGTIVIFPASMPHKVEMVTKGTRYVLVGWAYWTK